MSLSASTHAENFHGNQYNEVCFAKPDITEPNETQYYAFKRAEKPYNAEDEKNIKKSLIETLFESTIRRMELAVALPSLLLDPELSMILTSNEMDAINDIFLCDNEVCYKYLLSQSAFENRKSTINSETVGYISMSRFDRAVYKTLKILEKHINVLRMSSCYKCISLPSALFLHHIRYLLEQYLYKMSLTPKQARNKELYYRNLWRCHKKSTEAIARKNV